MDPRKDVTVSKRSALNPNAQEFIPRAFKSTYASANSSVVQKPVSAKDSSVVSTATNDSSNSSSFNDQNGQYWQSLLPDDIIPDFDNLEDDLMGVQSHEDENKVDSIELLAKSFPNFSEESVRHMYDACGGDLNFTMESLSELEYINQNDSDAHWESNMHSACGHTMDSSFGSSRSIQVSPNFTLDGIMANGNQLQTSSIPQGMHQQLSQVATNAGESLRTASLSYNLGEPTLDSSRNAYSEQARKTNLPARELALKGQWHDAEVRFAPCREEPVHVQRNMAILQLQNANSQHANNIKLQGCDVKEAIQILKPVIADRRYLYWKTGQQQLLSIDMGTCQSTHGSSAAAGLLLAVEQYLVEEENLQCCQEKSGELKVLISSQI
ncbi:hypothetical protein SUGI_0954590 [Cryptomeria japonica]|uniref:uncharacterized protein LOC131051286 n=1 Tax=Cryptomeria japonica TaxID=3369 RepID=UPI0024148D1D|nr:uncharacterized protein LOC131051286 [Cryptomeria japonica]XP_057841717.2 uncharacterized protein LOC131051286 [Cryptomeria japonica]GLJ45352.1 hypothetical protein SUGI_0954590 [Cryptomeria japonica]